MEGSEPAAASSGDGRLAVTKKEAAQLLGGVSISTIDRLRRRGVLEWRKTNHLVLITRESIDRFLASTILVEALVVLLVFICGLEIACICGVDQACDAASACDLSIG